MRKSHTRTKGANYYKKGSYNVICDYTGFKYKAEDTRMTWDGLRVGKDQWEARHPQDFVATLRDKQSVPNPRPPQPPNFVNTDEFTLLLSDNSNLLLSNGNTLGLSDLFG